MTEQSRPVCKSRRELEWSVCCGTKTMEARSQGLRASLGEKPGECTGESRREGGWASEPTHPTPEMGSGGRQIQGWL